MLIEQCKVLKHFLIAYVYLKKILKVSRLIVVPDDFFKHHLILAELRQSACLHKKQRQRDKNECLSKHCFSLI